MPELPEVETMCRGIRPVVGSRIVAIRRPRCRLKPIQISPQVATIQRRLKGQPISTIRRRGKRVVIVSESGHHLVIEPRMTGLVLLANPPNLSHLRLKIELDHPEHSAIMFWDRRGLGTVNLWSSEQFQQNLESRLGPEPLDVGLEQFKQQFASTRRAVKVALLDQTLIAGIGNIYASEILYVARVLPDRLCSEVLPEEWQAIRRATRKILNDAIRFEGSTLGDGTYRNALNESGSYQNHHRVYARAGERCRRCQAVEIQRTVQAQRATFFCPGCQV